MDTTTHPVKHLTNDQVCEILSVSECVGVVEDLFKDLSNTQMPPKIYLDIPNGDFRAMPAVVGSTAGIKWCGVHLDESGKKRKINIFAKVLINDVDSGKLLAIMDGESITAIRPAAVTGVATKYLSVPDARTAAFIGCGNQTKNQIEAVTSVRDILTIKLFDLDLDRAKALKEELEGIIQISCRSSVLVCESLEQCVRNANIVTTLTPSREGYLEYDWLLPDVHINAVGADAEGKRELCESVISNVDMVIYDNYEQCSHSGEIQYFEEDERWNSLESVVSGKRLKDDQIQATLFDATGLAIEDVATGRYIYEKLIKSEHNS